MLKALEVHGFKSFADKTRFDFPAGITVVVGPNGSGKSNVVDAIKWVLGEQSAKSLRGKDMADVIFKGAGVGANGRKPMNFAEVTIVFENDDHKLPVDAAEVHVTRRVYRSGEAEYLINRQPCRLKDIKDLFRGTGVGIDAYSIIEQGKVERILQASSKDRRAMFEEAAGISRFKAKKVEALRRLERVDQNLLRLRDIVEEVDHRLRGIRAQAGKARRYREYSDRLQTLRTATAWGDWQRLTLQLEQQRQNLGLLQQDLTAGRTQLEAAELLFRENEAKQQATQQTLRQLESQHGRLREQISARESAMEFERARLHDLGEESQRRRQQIVAMTSRVVGIRTLLKDIEEQLQQAEAERSAHAQRLATHEQIIAELTQRQDQQRSEIEQQRRSYVQFMREAAELGNRASSAVTQQEASREAIKVRQERLDVVRTALENYEAELAELQQQEQAQAAIVLAKRVQLESVQQELDKNRLVLSERLEDLAHLHGRFRGATERCTLLEDLENRREGWETGVKTFLDEARKQQALPGVRGMVADVVTASTEYAAMIDTALGEYSQAIVVEPDLARDSLLQKDLSTPGKVIFLGLFPRAKMSDTLDLSGRPGVIGRGDQVVKVSAGFESLVAQLLAETWLVESLSVAVQLRNAGFTTVRFVTRAGQCLLADGTLILGASQGAAGLISRRSELRTLREELAIYERQINEAEQEVAELRKNISTQESLLKRHADAHRLESETLADRQVAIRAYQQRGEQLSRQRTGLEKEIAEYEKQLATAELDLRFARSEQEKVEEAVRELESTIAARETTLREQEKQRAEHQQTSVLCRVDLARSEQKVDAQRIQHFQALQDEQERDRLLADSRQQLVGAKLRHEEGELLLLNISAELAQWYARKEQWADEIEATQRMNQEVTWERTHAHEQMQTLRKEIRRLEEQSHELQLAEGATRMEWQTLGDRMREDYSIDLAAIQEPPAMEERPRSEIDEEISALRKKINSIGAVNLESLNEIDELEARHQHLSSQYQDLENAKNQLEKIIHKINADSRRIFLETLDAIRTNFQALYRRAFGGGKADLVLEEGIDVLESGVDIQATPPGKPTFSNSLLSGGEKALTAVALLLAIFQFRPSPFCVLDEVDAPFDEANIGRFMEVIRDFLGGTRFIIVTHSKKTMTSANTLYGVTMQESGISKRVSVRFDDVTDDGHIKREAIDRENETADAGAA
jgi:chromosome segregation protein